MKYYHNTPGYYYDNSANIGQFSPYKYPHNYNTCGCDWCHDLRNSITHSILEHEKNRFKLPERQQYSSVEEAVDALTKFCESMGWEVQINPAMAYGDRKGQQITILEPKKETDVQSIKK